MRAGENRRGYAGIRSGAHEPALAEGGLAVRQWRQLPRAHAGRPDVAVHVHVGSQITTTEPLRRAAAFLAGLAGDIGRLGIALEYLGLAKEEADIVSGVTTGGPVGTPSSAEEARA